MKYVEDIQYAHSDPRKLEIIFRRSQTNNDVAQFEADMISCYQSSPDNPFYAAWFHRMTYMPKDVHSTRQKINWKLALPLGLVNGILLWLLSNEGVFVESDTMFYVAILAGPTLAIFAVIFLSLTSQQVYMRALAISGALVAVATYVLFLVPKDIAAYCELMVPHLVALSWASVGLFVIRVGAPTIRKFSFLIKSTEVIITSGLFIAATFIFAAIVTSMFELLNFELADIVTRMMFVGLGGTMPMLSIASTYNPTIAPDRQDFTRGVGWLIATFPPVMLALTLAALVVYLAVIPFNFMAPFNNRDVLVTCNIMLFGVIGLLLTSTPVMTSNLSRQLESYLRAGIIIVASLVVLVSLHALAAVIHRAVGHGLTVNRITITGWNIINIALLTLIIYRQLRHGKLHWISCLQKTFGDGALAYFAWSVCVIIVTPWLF